MCGETAESPSLLDKLFSSVDELYTLRGGLVGFTGELSLELKFIFSKSASISSVGVEDTSFGFVLETVENENNFCIAFPISVNRFGRSPITGLQIISILNTVF